MKLENEPFFKETSSLGALYITDVYMYYDEPVLFKCRSEDWTLDYLCMLVNHREWLIVPDINGEIDKIISNNAPTIREFIQKSLIVDRYKLSWHFDDLIATVSWCPGCDIPEEDLPDADLKINDYSEACDD